MNWDYVEGQWMQFRGVIREKWGELTDDDLTVIAGQKDRFIGRLQERYGITREKAEQEVDDWLLSLKRDPE